MNAQAQQTLSTTQEKPKTVKDWLSSDTFKSQVKAALPSHMTPERFVRVALTTLMKTPKLAECTQHSIFKVMLDCSSLGLEPDGRRAHIIPYGTEATLIIDYKGLIELAKRSGEVKNWRAELVCENDVFSWENGIVTHKVDWLKSRGKALAVYSHVRNSNDVDDYEVMTMDQVEAIRQRSRAKNTGPWVTDFNEMAKKTVIRRHSKRLTLSPEFSEALSKDFDRADDIVLPADDFNVIDMPKRLSETATEPATPPISQESAQAPQPEAGAGSPPVEAEKQGSAALSHFDRLLALCDEVGVPRAKFVEYLNSVIGMNEDTARAVLSQEEAVRCEQWLRAMREKKPGGRK